MLWITVGSLLGIIVLVVGFIAGHRYLRHQRHEHAKEAPFPAEWVEIISKNVPLYLRLPEKLQQELHDHVKVFLDEKEFEGCGGLEMTDEIRVTIAAQACILLLNREPTYYPDLNTILVYPSAYIARDKHMQGGQVIEGEPSVRLGESWLHGNVVLAWDHVLNNAQDYHDGHNVVFHEFAHQLDQETGAGDGCPVLPQRSMYLAWARVLGHDYEELCGRVEKHKKDVMDAYGATNPAEFFAVATETFFEKAKQLQRKHPELYEELKEYYQVDPIQWA